MHTISLPRIGADVPLAIASSEVNRRLARLTLHLIEQDVIQLRHVRASTDDPRRVCSAAMSDRLKSRLGALGVFSPQVSITLREGDADTVWLAIAYGPVEWVDGADVLEKLEADAPGLGADVLKTIDAFSWRVAPIITPSLTLELCSYCEWCGEQDERERLAMCEADTPAELAAAREEIITRAAFDAEFPKWAVGWREGQSVEKVWTDLDLLRQVPFAARLAPHMRALAQVCDTMPKWEHAAADEGAYQVGWAGGLSWRGSQLQGRILDDYMELAWNSESYEDTVLTELDVSSPQAVRTTLGELAVWCDGLRHLDGLMNAIRAEESQERHDEANTE